jgi:hypothetical protein
MLAFLRDRGASERKLRLFAVACCLDVWDLIEAMEEAGIGYGWGAVLLAEYLADGKATRAEVASAVLDCVGMMDSGSSPESQLLCGLPALADADAARGAEQVSLRTALARNRAATRRAAMSREESQSRPSDASREEGRLAGVEMLGRQCGFLRDIFGNPLRPATFEPSWRSGTAVALARQMYETRDFLLMGVLSDALQDAGCADEDILNHCRSPVVHVRGCFVVDLVLNRA